MERRLIDPRTTWGRALRRVGPVVCGLLAGCIANPVARDPDTVNQGVGDARVADGGVHDATPPAPDAAPDAGPVPTCVVEMNNPRTGAPLHRCELFERSELSVCEQVAQCLCVGRLELDEVDWQAGELLTCMLGELEARGAPTLNDYCYASTVSEVAESYGFGDVEAAGSATVGPGCDTLVLSQERALPWPVPADDRCELTLRDRETSVERTCPIATANPYGSCEQIAHCLCAPALEAEEYRNTEYYGCLVRAFLGDLSLRTLCQAPGATVSDLPARFDDRLLYSPPLQYDLSTSPGCATVPLDPRAGTTASTDPARR